MKVETKKTEFQPVVITLESQLEVDALSDVVALVTNYSEEVVHGSEQWNVKEFLGALQEGIDDLASDQYNFVYFNTPADLFSFK